MFFCKVCLHEGFYKIAQDMRAEQRSVSHTQPLALDGAVSPQHTCGGSAKAEAAKHLAMPCSRPERHDMAAQDDIDILGTETAQHPPWTPKIAQASVDDDVGGQLTHLARTFTELSEKLESLELAAGATTLDAAKTFGCHEASRGGDETPQEAAAAAQSSRPARAAFSSVDGDAVIINGLSGGSPGCHHQDLRSRPTSSITGPFRYGGMRGALAMRLSFCVAYPVLFH